MLHLLSFEKLFDRYIWKKLFMNDHSLLEREISVSFTMKFYRKRTFRYTKRFLHRLMFDLTLAYFAKQAGVRSFDGSHLLISPHAFG